MMANTTLSASWTEREGREGGGERGGGGTGERERKREGGGGGDRGDRQKTD